MVKAATASKRHQYRIRYGIVAFLAAFAALGSFMVAYEEDVTNLRRQAALVVEQYADYVEEIASNAGTENDDSKACPLLHTSKTSSNVVIDKPAIRAQSNEKLNLVKQFTYPQYEQYMMEVPGKEHYPLWHYLTKTYHDTEIDCRHVVDIGTRFVASSLALGSTGVPVKTFDIPTSTERTFAFRGKSEEEWQHQLQTTAGVHIEFQNLDLLKISDEDFRDYMSTWLIVLDTFHQPYTVPFEREFLTRLRTMEPKFEGILMLDDIHFNPEMERWWKELQDNADQWGFKAHDLTSVGHVSGTGLLDFSGNVAIKE